MEKVTFHYHGSNSLSSRLIQWRSGSNISHVSIEVRGWRYNAYIESRFYRTTEPEGDEIESESFYVTKEMADDIEQHLIDWLGKLYDVKAMWGFVINRRKQSSNRKFCSEIANEVLEYIVPGKVQHNKLLTPSDIRLALAYFNLGVKAKVEE